jgi:hypothetical protein
MLANKPRGTVPYRAMSPLRVCGRCGAPCIRLTQACPYYARCRLNLLCAAMYAVARRVIAISWALDDRLEPAIFMSGTVDRVMPTDFLGG